MILDQILVFLMKFCTILTKLKIVNFENFGWRNFKISRVQNLVKNNKFWFIFRQFCYDFDFLVTNFNKMLRFLQNRDFQVSEFCDQVVKFVWQVWCHLVNLTIVTHSPTSPWERSHSSDIDSWKNDLKTHHIDHQNVQTKSWPKISSSLGIKI